MKTIICLLFTLVVYISSFSQLPTVQENMERKREIRSMYSTPTAAHFLINEAYLPNGVKYSPSSMMLTERPVKEERLIIPEVTTTNTIKIKSSGGCNMMYLPNRTIHVNSIRTKNDNITNTQTIIRRIP